MAMRLRLGLWVRAMRAPFFQAVIIPTVLGTAVAWYQTGIFHSAYFLLALFGVVFLHGGTNLANDYFDHKSGADDINREPTPFSGGSRVIQEGLISPRAIWRASLFLFGLGALIGLYLAWARGWPILVIGAIGVLSGYFYTAPPMKLGYRGWGEVVCGLNCGPLVVLGAYYVQAQDISVEAFLASLPIGLLIAAVLYINQFPDYATDKRARKGTLIVKVGRERAIKGFCVLSVLAYLVIVFGALARVIPLAGLISLLTLPLAWKTIKIARANYWNVRGLLPAMSNTVMLHLTVGLLLSFGFLMAGMWA